MGGKYTVRIEPSWGVVDLLGLGKLDTNIPAYTESVDLVSENHDRHSLT